MAITSDRDKLRLKIGDTDTDNELFQDDELDAFIAEAGSNLNLAGALACEAAARKFARAYDFETDGQSFKRSQQSKAFMELAKSLRAQAGGIATVDVTKVDGYSDDIANQDVSGGGDANPRHFYARVGVADLPYLARDGLASERSNECSRT